MKLASIHTPYRFISKYFILKYFFSIKAEDSLSQEGWGRCRGWSKEGSEGRWASQPLCQTPLLTSATGSLLPSTLHPPSQPPDISTLLTLTPYMHFTDTLLNATKRNNRKVCRLLNATRIMVLLFSAEGDKTQHLLHWAWLGLSLINLHARFKFLNWFNFECEELALTKSLQTLIRRLVYI